MTLGMKVHLVAAWLTCCLLAPWATAPPEGQAQDLAPALESEVAPEDWLVVCDMPTGGGREPLGDDVGLALLAGTFAPPVEGQEVRSLQHPGARTAWRRLHLPGGKFDQGISGKFYAYACVETAGPRRAVLVANGVSRVYFNDAIIPGDAYAAGWAQFPVLLRAGRNHLTVVALARAGMSVRLLPARAPVQLDLADVTAPDAVRGRALDAPIGIPVLNTTDRTIADAVLTVGAGDEDGFAPRHFPLPPIAPGQTLKVPVAVKSLGPLPADEQEAAVSVRVCALGVEDAGEVELRVQAPEDAWKLTFVSVIDGSGQYCGVREASAPAGRPGLVLTLHGASVEGIGQAAAYASKPDLCIVAPTNRRPFGFDWEDWGMLDALETLEVALARFGADPDRVYLTGHSMGGHGTWGVGLLHPDRFAAIGPSAGWVSFALYGGGGGGATSFGPPVLQDILGRCRRHSDLLGFLDNASAYGIYVLHGVDDDNVPVSQARMMKYFLGPAHRDFAYHEEPGAGHWWDKTKDRPGADCVDWLPMFEFFAGRRRPKAREEFVFVTPSPAISSRFGPIAILAEASPNSDARVSLARDPARGTLSLRTSNVACMEIDPAGFPDPRPQIDLDGWPINPALLAPGLPVVREGGRWHASGTVPWTGKRPGLHGPLKEAFFRPFVFVYGTQGTPEETMAARAVAVGFANVWWWRGNGFVRVLADTDVEPELAKAHNLILFGHRGSNALLAQAELPIRVEPGRIRVGERTYEGPGLACAFVHPGPHGRLWAVFGGTDATGMRLAALGDVLRSGVGLPDFTVWDGKAVLQGFGAARCAGYFDARWRLEGGLGYFGE